MEELIKKIEANYIALANLERNKKQNHISDDNDSYITSKNNISEALNVHLQEYKERTGTDFELSNEIKQLLKEYEKVFLTKITEQKK